MQRVTLLSPGYRQCVASLSQCGGVAMASASFARPHAYNVERSTYERGARVAIMATILLVEDARELAAVVVRELEAAGYRVRHEADGRAALAAHVSVSPDLVILDWMLPGMDGLEVLRQI